MLPTSVPSLPRARNAEREWCKEGRKGLEEVTCKGAKSCPGKAHPNPKEKHTAFSECYEISGIRQLRKSQPTGMDSPSPPAHKVQEFGGLLLEPQLGYLEGKVFPVSLSKACRRKEQMGRWSHGAVPPTLTLFLFHPAAFTLQRSSVLCQERWKALEITSDRAGLSPHGHTNVLPPGELLMIQCSPPGQPLPAPCPALLSSSCMAKKTISFLLLFPHFRTHESDPACSRCLAKPQSGTGQTGNTTLGILTALPAPTQPRSCQDFSRLGVTHSSAVREQKGTQSRYWPYCYSRERQLLPPWKPPRKQIQGELPDLAGSCQPFHLPCLFQESCPLPKP